MPAGRGTTNRLFCALLPAMFRGIEVGWAGAPLTDLLVRLVTGDDPKQAAAAEAVVSKGAWVSHVVLAEVVWVLESAYGLKPAQIAVAVDMLIEHEHLTIQDADVVAAALRAFRGKRSAGFTDCLVLAIAKKAGHSPLGTFERRLSKLDGAELV